MLGIKDVIAFRTNGYGTCLALKADGTLWAWGENGNGQLGNGTLISSRVPSQVFFPNRVTAMALDSDTCYAIDSEGKLYHWGLGVNDANGEYQKRVLPALALAALVSDTPMDKKDPVPNLKPTAVSGLPPMKSIEITMVDSVQSRYAALVLGIALDGTAWTFGGLYREPITQVRGLTDVVAVAGDKFSSFVIRADGTAWGWGGESDSPLGDGSADYQENPTRIKIPTPIHSIVTNRGTRYAVDATGAVWGWGTNNGTLGVSAHAGPIAKPIRLPYVSNATSILAVANSVFVTSRNGRVYSWGSNDYGQLGAWAAAWREMPSRIPDVRGVTQLISAESVLSDIPGVPPTAFSARWAPAIYALTNRGELWAWGNNLSGRLGVVDGDKVMLPVRTQEHCNPVASVFAVGRNAYLVSGDPSTPSSGGTTRRKRRRWFSGSS